MNSNKEPNIFEGLPLQLEHLKGELYDELNSLLFFWSTKALDLENGGVIGMIDHYGNPHKEASKGSVLHSRLLWTFSAAYRITECKNYKTLADAVFDYIVRYFWDDVNGGLFWEVDFKGNPINKRKQAYAQGFGIYAFTEYYRATECTESLNYAIKLFNILEEKFKDQKFSGYLEALQHDWSSIDDMRLSEKDQNAPKSMNTHLHILEPYTNLYRVWKDERLKCSMMQLLEIFQHKIMDNTTGHFHLFFDMNWKVQSHGISFGHDIEGSWLLHEAALVLQEAKLIEAVKQTSLKLVNTTMKNGLDEDGSVFNGFEHGRYDTDKHWWPQAEALVGFMDAYQMEPDKKYLQAVFKIWHFIKNNMIDRENGEWFWRVDKNGKPNPEDVKLGFWKCPYHNSRALLELIERIEKITN
ncbi:AGE family epimerase/isomerase [Robertkochia aurantiaca]|uniref:AGE family epimerase/isomerase n=1 Tax=Robertkochia aurantiaca TaxID=2873700 RepID=UPI001CCD011B|nr:AGE family epimerase/isomerase [Robertkochia sp. 3YJGBD-33]